MTPASGERGQATVELALLLPVVALLLLAVVQVAVVAQADVLVAHAAREAARAAAVDPDPAAARAAADQGGGLDPARTRVEVRDRAGVGSTVRVRVTYRLPTTVPVVGALVPDVTLEASAAMRVER